MVMGSIFDTPTDEEDQNPPQPQQPPPQDPLAQQPTQDQIDSLNHAQGIVQQGLQTVTNMFGPQAQQTADQNSLTSAQGLVNNAFQGIQTVGNAVDQDQASANQRLAQVTGGMGQDPLSRGLSQVGPAMNWAQNNIINNIPVPGPVGEGLNLASAGMNALGVNAPNLGSVGGVMQAANLPAEQLPNIPGFSSQPQIAQQFEQGAVGAAPYVLGGPESALGKVASIGLGGLGSVADQNLGTQLGPLGLGQLLGMGLPGLFDRGPRPETPIAQPEPSVSSGISNQGYEPPTPAQPVQPYQPAPLPDNTLYHGTGSRFEAFDDTGAKANQTALFGPGVYLTDSRPIAEGYAKNGESSLARQNAREERTASIYGSTAELTTPEGTIHSVQLRSDLNLMDLEKPVPENVNAHLQQQAQQAETGGWYDSEAWDAAAKAAQSGQPGKGIYSAFKEGLMDAGSTRSEAGEALQELSDQIHGLGYDGLTHKGGINGGPEHNVTILFDPHEAQITNSEPLHSPTTTTAPTSTTTTSGGNYWDTTGIGPKYEAEQQRGPYIQWINENIHPDEQRVYKAALADVLAGKQAQAPTPEGTLGPDPQTNPYRTAHDSIRQNLAPDMPYLAAPPPGSGATETPFRAYPGAPREAAPAGEPAPPAGNMVFAEGHDGNIHTITGFNGIRDGQQWFQTDTGEVPLSLLKNLSSGDLAELGRMRTAAGATNLPNPQPITGQPGSPGAQGFQQSPAGQQFAGQGAAGMNVTQPGVSSSNAAPSTTYGGGAGGITGQAPPAGGQPPSGGGQGGTGKPMPAPPRGVNPNAFQQTVAIIRAPLRILLAAPGHFLRVGAGQSATHWGEFSDALGDWARTLGSDAGKKAVQAELHDLSFVGGTLPANVPGDVRAETFRAQAGGNPPLNRAWIDKTMESVPILGPALRRMGEANGQFMASMRDSVYNTAAEKIARTVPDADVKFYKDTYDGISHSSGFSTGIPGFRGQGAGQALGTAPNSVIAKFQTLIDPVIKSGGPVPFVNAGARAENIRSLMGTAGIIGTINALGVAFGGKVSLPFSVAGIPASNITTPFGVESDLFKVITTNPAGTAKTAYSGASGYDTMLRLFANAGMAAFNGDWTGKNSVESHTLAWLRGELGPVPGTALDLLLGENWRGDPYGPKGGAQGMVNFNKDLHQGFANHWAPIAAQNMKAAYDAYGPEGLIRAAPSLGAFEAQTSPINTSSQAFKYNATPATLSAAFQGEDKPLATILQGKDWNDLMSTEKSALTKSLSPEQLQQIHDESFRQNPETTKHSDTVQYISDKKLATENATLDRYNRKEITADEAASQMKAAQREYFAVKNQLDSMPGYLAEQKKFDKSNESGAQIVLDGFYQIQNKADRAAYINQIMAHDPELGARLLLATQPRNQSKLEELYYSGQLK